MTRCDLGLETCPDKVSPHHLEQFERDGYLAFADVLSSEETQQSRQAFSELVLRCVKDPHEIHGSTLIQSGARFRVQFENGYVPQEDDPDLELKVRKLMWFADQLPIFEYLSSSQPHIHEPLRAMLGENPLLFQDMALVKPPFIGSEKPWHQDNAYFSVKPLDAVCGVWIALDDATVENGCMHVIPGGHKTGALGHVRGRDCEIPLEKIDRARVRPVEIPAGGAMFFKGMLPHQTPPNTSPQRRRALQFHYRSRASELIPKEEYAQLFSEVDPATGECCPASCAFAPKLN